MTAVLSEATWLAMLAFCRIGACFLVIPGFSSSRVPAQARLFVVIAISVSMLTVIWPKFVGIDLQNPLSFFKLVTSEIIIGLFLGLTVRYYMLALGFMANAIGMLIGYGSLFGPGFEDTEPQAAIGTLLSMAVLLLLMILNFHHAVVGALIGSYTLIPISGAVDTDLLLMNLTDILKDSFLLVLRLGSPFLAYALILNLMIGVLNKLTPQIPIYFVSLPFIMCGGLFLLYFSVPSFLNLFMDGFKGLWLLR